MYLQETEDTKGKEKWAPTGPASRAYFYKAWTTCEQAQHIKTRKTLRFSLCDECVKFMERRMHVMSDKERELVKKEQYAHHMFVRGQRGSYYGRRHEAVSDPRRCFSIILDAADQSAFGSPHLHVHSKEDEGHWKIATHLMGAIVYGRVCHGFTFLPNIKHGTNITIEALHRVLQHEFQRNGQRPFEQRCLYLQLDNTTKQCKSRFLLGYLALLVAWDVFAEVVLSFLPVGHTHEDIDQMFSRIAVWLRKHDATSRIGFREAIVAGFQGKWKGNVVTDNIERAANVSDWIGDFMAPIKKNKNGNESCEGITKFHQFRLTLLQGVAIMQVREWCDTPVQEYPWRGLVPGSTHHVVFTNQAPVPDDLARQCPPAQRSTLPSKEEYVIRNRRGEVISNYTSKTRKGVEAIIANRNITGEAFADLHACLDLLESSEDLLFDWDMKLYNTHYAARGGSRDRVNPIINGLRVVEGGERSEQSDVDDEAPPAEDDDSNHECRQLNFDDVKDSPPLPPDVDGYVPSGFLVGQVYLVRMGGREWGLAR
jgi:hypothetical protein